MGALVIVLLPVALVLVGTAGLIGSFVRRDTGDYDLENLWEDRHYTAEDYRLIDEEDSLK
ncbi:hypothetical protein QUF84_20010 [Fictibacillus enclensis]|uniref:Uncharacterized protein n=1 Tax=Fictibacillus enclensis TaxID=1017270 RepID=A0A0V8J8V3_9BACL|nr:hypothetical protein [Fictibacillus enclensis]KSU83567.1 hypothetical protein AS030_13520 [Fictibacillus enclensis]MDM5200176.1 hypothetical protein [Fictibacillus enclensis]MDM5339488.1 hypothetical protein [Fictibacillus enclensis]WHY70934.1 hypothetical protein QNH15_18090 [Fictibacillus enclensis]SCC17609.1 hypothetical protein GA0061096_2855 [Fictibacillus enclensis]